MSNNTRATRSSDPDDYNIRDKDDHFSELHMLKERFESQEERMSLQMNEMMVMIKSMQPNQQPQESRNNTFNNQVYQPRQQHQDQRHYATSSYHSPAPPNAKRHDAKTTPESMGHFQGGGDGGYITQPYDNQGYEYEQNQDHNINKRLDFPRDARDENSPVKQQHVRKPPPVREQQYP
jgi:hypothetical protein